MISFEFLVIFLPHSIIPPMEAMDDKWQNPFIFHMYKF